jgi:hypothetical protein
VDSNNSPPLGTAQQEPWVTLYDDFVNLEGQCSLLCELLVGISRRDMPLDPAGRHGVELFAGQLKQQLQLVKRQLCQLRPG